jgi:anti-repressor protein
MKPCCEVLLKKDCFSFMDIQIFKNPLFGEVRTLKLPDGQVGFVGKDVATALGYQDSKRAVYDHVDVDDKTTVLIQHPGSNYKTNAVVINESGLYSLVLSSKLPQAKEFKHWVTSEVLPQIRQTGGYIPVKQEDDELTIMARAHQIMQKTIEKKNKIIEAQRPLVDFANAVTSSKGSILIGELAKLITQNGFEIGRTRLFRWLRNQGYLFQHSTAPIQKWVERGLFETHVTLVSTNHGTKEMVTTKVTGKGQEYFINLFINNKNY